MGTSKSIVFDAENRHCQLRCVAECEVIDKLLLEEKEKLANFIADRIPMGR